MLLKKDRKVVLVKCKIIVRVETKKQNPAEKNLLLKAK